MTNIKPKLTKKQKQQLKEDYLDRQRVKENRRLYNKYFPNGIGISSDI